MNSVEVIGYLREPAERKLRLVEIALPAIGEDGKNTAKIYVKHWMNGEKNYLLTQPESTHVAIRGHLDNDEKFGTIIVAEQIYALK